ncbi:MAG: 5'-3' exonuclease H3TH domain-containing protein, partial [Microcystaceae cyanobacterium]
TATGIPTSVCFGFLNSLFQTIETQKPSAIAIAFDRREPTFRHEADVNYKAGRQETPEEFMTDLHNLRALLAALNIPTITYPGYEADDILGTLAIQASQAGYQVKIVSGDRDLFQLVDDQNQIKVLYLSRNPFQGVGYSEFDQAAVIEKMGVTPEQIVDYKALCGDASDNIPGVRGIGEKTAVKLLEEYQSLAAVYSNLPTIKGAIKKKLQEGEESAKHSQHLAKIVLDVPVDVDLEDLQLQPANVQEVKPLLETLELRSFFSKIDKFQQQLNGDLLSQITAIAVATESQDNQQLSLFSASSNTNSNTNFIAPKLANIIQPEIIDNETKLQSLVERLSQSQNLGQAIAWDTETTGLDPFTAELVGIGCAWGEKITDMAYIPIGHKVGPQLSKVQVLKALA